MGKQLIIVESPTKARTLSRFLGSDYQIEATMGHVRDLPAKELGVDVQNDFKPLYQEIPKQKDTIKRLKDAVSDASAIILATDPDREGEAIAWHTANVIRSQLKIKNYELKIKRIVFHEITKEAIEDALKNPRTIDMHLVDAQQARRVLDRLMGYQLSPLLWAKTGKYWLSAGRVQSIAVRLIVEREQEIKAFIPDEYWKLFAHVFPKKSSEKDLFIAEFIGTDGKKIEVKTKLEADTLYEKLVNAHYSVAGVKRDQQLRRSVPPFITSTLQRSCASIFGWSARKTMTIAQNLYEEGLITYHRTDSVTLSSQALAMSRSFIEKTYGKKYLPDTSVQYKTKSKVAQEAHEAIRPTSLSKLRITNYELRNKATDSLQQTDNQQLTTNNQLGSDHQKLLDLVTNRFLASQMNPQIVERTVVDCIADSNYLFRAVGEREVFDGWRVLYKNPNLKSPELPNLNQGDQLHLSKLDKQQKFTQPPSRYNEGSLIKALEEAGIGRPSTYAPIIHTIQLRQYVEKDEKRAFFPTELGVGVNDFLVKEFDDLINVAFTSNLENDLDEIANGNKDWVESIRAFYTVLDGDIQKAKKKTEKITIAAVKTGEKCPDCGGDLIERVGRYGKFIACSTFPKCKFTKPIIITIDVPCPKCKGQVVLKKTKKGRKFFGCGNYPKCDFASWQKPKKQ